MKVCPKAVKTLKPPIKKIPTSAVEASSSFFKRNGCLIRRVAVPSKNAAAVNEIALIESGSISARRKLTAGQFKPHKRPINGNVDILIKWYIFFKESPQRVFRFFIKASFRQAY